MYELGEMSLTEMNVLVFVIYLASVLYILEIAMALHNIWFFLIKQGKYKTWPLLLFYMLVTMLGISRFYYSLWFFEIQLDYGLPGHNLKPLYKINLGVVQCWMLIELSLRIKENL